MDNPPQSDHREIKKAITQPLLGTTATNHVTTTTATQKGGFRTLPFIIANEAFEKLASFGLVPNMTLYLMKEYHLELVDASKMLYFWSAIGCFLPVIGACIADSKVGRYRMIGFGSIVSLLGITMLWLTTMIPQARPPPCHKSGENCIPPTTPQLLLLCSCFILMAIGSAGIRSSSLAFGAEQIEKKNSVRTSGALESYFSWYYVSAATSITVAMTCIVYLQDHFGWKIGFGVPVALMLLSVVSFFLASSWYIKAPVKSSVVASLAQVIVASYRNRRIVLPSEIADAVYHYKEGSTGVLPSEKLRFLNKACIVRYPDEDSDRYRLCTIEQVEELKALIKIVPLWSTVIVLDVSISQHTFPVIQASSMDRHLTPSFEIPAGSMGTFLILTVTIWIALYDRVILPLASRIMKRPVRLCPKTRMGIGLFLIFVSMIVISTVESVRRAKANERVFVGPIDMSVLWLVPQNCLIGLAEAFNAIGQNEFYFTELPRSMSSIAITLGGVAAAVANILGSLMMSFVDDITGRDGKESWVSSDINKGHFDYYYMVLSGLCLVNIVYFLICSRVYGPCEGERGGGGGGGRKAELEAE